ncbi:MAG: IS66 family insertion sequence element accessory protein TnpB [Planctomycetota bacterium]
MIDFSDVRIFLCTTPTNMNYSFDRLMGRAQEIFQQDPCSGHLFLFLNRSPGTDRRLVAAQDLVLGSRRFLHFLQEARTRKHPNLRLYRSRAARP